MILTIYNILTTKNPNLLFLKWSLIFAIIVIILIVYRYLQPEYNKESFQQKEKFVIKRNDDAIDTFYAEIYNALHDVDKRSNKELMHILTTTNPSTKDSVFLDVGSGTGFIVNELEEAGYTAYGIEKSKDMISYSESLYPDIEIIHGNALEPMSFEKGIFTHVLCNYFTIYNFDNKLQFFRNVYHWMRPGGYLIVHLVDKNKFEKIIPHEMAITEKIETSPSNLHLRIKAIFNDFEYIGKCEIPNDRLVTFTETMTDLTTKHIRQNETTLYMEDLDTILDFAKKAGFVYHAKTNMENINRDINQYIYYFERPL